MLVFALMADKAAGDKLCTSQVHPRIAQSWRWLDDTTFEIKVRQGVRFQNKPPVNGRELTAEDVAFTMNRSFSVPKRGLGILPRHVKEIKATDRYTVRVITDSPQPGIVDLYLTNFYGSHVLPREAPKERMLDTKFWVGAGPFSLESYTPGVKLAYAKHPGFWKKGLPYLDGVEEIIIPDQSTRLAAIRGGTAHLWYGQVPVAAAKAIEATARGVQIQRCPASIGQGKVAWRTDKPDSPFADVRVRRAVSMAIDREGLLRSALQGEGEIVALYPPGHSKLHLALDDLSPELRKLVTYNPEEAKRLLAEAGYPNGFEATLSTTRRYGSPYTELVEGFISSLERVGIRLTPEWLEYGSWAKGPIAGDYKDIMIHLVPVANPMDELGRYHSQAGFKLNRSHLNDPTLDSLIDKLRSTTDEAEQVALARQIQERIIDQAYTVILPIAFDYAIFQDKVKGFLFTGDFHWTSPYLERVWLER